MWLLLSKIVWLLLIKIFIIIYRPISSTGNYFRYALVVYDITQIYLCFCYLVSLFPFLPVPQGERVLHRLIDHTKQSSPILNKTNVLEAWDLFYKRSALKLSDTLGSTHLFKITVFHKSKWVLQNMKFYFCRGRVNSHNL